MRINISMNKMKATIKSWRMGEYFRQFSIVAAGVIVTFWGSDWISERARQREVRATMQLVAEELEHNRQELRNIKHLLDVDIHMSDMLINEHNFDVSQVPVDTLYKYRTLFNNLSEFNYRTDALDVLKGSSLMQYISDKRLLQDVLQTYFELGMRQKDVDDYYKIKNDIVMNIIMSKKKHTSSGDDSLLEQALFLMKQDEFVNFVIMVPGFLYWEEFTALDEKLAHQIQVLKDKYK